MALYNSSLRLLTKTRLIPNRNKILFKFNNSIKISIFILTV